MSDRVVWMNGQLVPEVDARVSIYDSALVMGEMAFEVTRTFHHRPFRLRQHLERLFHTLGVLHIAPWMTIEALERVTEEVLIRNLSTAHATTDWNIIHSVSRGPSPAFAEAFIIEALHPTVVVSCFPLTAKLAALAAAYRDGVDLVVPPQQAIPGTVLDSSIKTRSRIHYQLANLQAAAMRPGSLAVLVDPDGYLTEGTSANLFVVRSGTVLTPEPRNVLPGITRDVVFELCSELGIACREKNLTPADALAADEIFLTSTSIGVLHARSFEGHVIADGRLGPITAQLREAFDRLVGVDIEAQALAYSVEQR
ncbi:MAG TPA: aminotransferase class IV [Pirellulales bacterium]|jgi:branched-chain amino acid aminotransferase|nr:aminotransferase class IV [Pirellulales bacterium]